MGYYSMSLYFWEPRVMFHKVFSGCFNIEREGRCLNLPKVGRFFFLSAQDLHTCNSWQAHQRKHDPCFVYIFIHICILELFSGQEHPVTFIVLQLYT